LDLKDLFGNTDAHSSLANLVGTSIGPWKIVFLEIIGQTFRVDVVNEDTGEKRDVSAPMKTWRERGVRAVINKDL